MPATLTLHIDQVEPGLYEAHLTHDSQEVTASTLHGSISEALAHAGTHVPEDFAHFLEVWYADVSIGMHSTIKLRTESEALADQLMGLAAAVWHSEQQLQAR